MRKHLFALAVLLVLAACPGEVALAQAIDIACDCSESDGTHRYRYTLRAREGPVTLQRFRVGTQDLNPANYSGWQAPAGFNATGTPVSSSNLPTPLLKSPHGVAIPSGPPVPSSGEIVWSGTVSIPPGETVTFGFDHPFPSWDSGWHALTRMATGPLDVFGEGYVHAPAPGAPHAATALTGWGVAALGALFLTTVGWVLSRHRRSAGG